MAREHQEQEHEQGQEQKKSYKSPQRKLLKFFEKSRDSWKAKCREAKRTVKRLKNRIRFLQQSKEQWKDRARSLELRFSGIKFSLRQSCAETVYEVFPALLVVAGVLSFVVLRSSLAAAIGVLQAHPFERTWS